MLISKGKWPTFIPCISKGHNQVRQGNNKKKHYNYDMTTTSNINANGFQFGYRGLK